MQLKLTAPNHNLFHICFVQQCLSFDFEQKSRCIGAPYVPYAVPQVFHQLKIFKKLHSYRTIHWPDFY